jgi:hypothetical protein
MNLTLRNLHSDLAKLRERDGKLTSKLDVFVVCLLEDRRIQDRKRQGCIELVTALVNRLASPDRRTLSTPLVLCDAVACTLSAHQNLSRVWEVVAAALRERP